MKRNKGITMIALIVTIIVLLLLVGITINQLNQTGVLEKTKTAKQEQTKAEIQEKIQLLLNEYQIEKVNNNELTLIKYFEGKKSIKEIDDYQDNKDGTLDIEEKGYTITIEINTQTILDIKESSSISFKYELTSYKDNKFKILIKVIDNKNGIDSVKLPDGDTLSYSGKNEIGMDFEADEGTEYIFIAKNKKGQEKEEKIYFIKPAEPHINTPDIGIPTLTLTRVESPKIEINYDERSDFINYYSLDDGTTWNVYTGAIDATSKKIIAKSEFKKCIGIYTEKTSSIEQPANALKPEGYDKDLNTFAIYDYYPNYNCTFKVDETTYNKQLTLTYENTYTGGGWRNSSVIFYDKSGTVIESKVLSGISLSESKKYEDDVIIPSGAYRVEFILDLGFKLYETSVHYVKPEISIIDEKYPTFVSENEVENRSLVKIQYDSKAVTDNYYSEDNGNTWEIYTGEITTLADTILAKSVLQNDKTMETPISTINLPLASNVIKPTAYDGDTDTYDIYNSYPNYNCIFKVSEVTNNKQLTFVYASAYGGMGSRTSLVNFYDKSNSIIEKKTLSTVSLYGTQKKEDTVTIPTGTCKVEFYLDLGFKLYEVSVK